MEVKRFLIYTLGQQLRGIHKETNKTTEKSHIYGCRQIHWTCYPLQKPLRRILKLIFMNLEHNKFTENMYEHTMQINHDEELSLPSDCSPLLDQLAEWNISFCE